MKRERKSKRRQKEGGEGEKERERGKDDELFKDPPLSAHVHSHMSYVTLQVNQC